MKNILYIGPYTESNGLGYSSRRWIEYLLSRSDINLSISPVFFTQSTIRNRLSLKKYEPYEGKTLDKYDYVIQHGYPEMFVYDKRFGKHIGLTEIETRSIFTSGWKNHLNLMDELWVNSNNALKSLSDIGVYKPIIIRREPYDTNKYNQSYDPFFTDKNTNKPFIFYVIGQYDNKKNIKDIILAYLLEFNRHDNVRLFIKAHNYYADPHTLDEIIKRDILEIKSALRKKTYCDIDFVTGILSDNDIIRLHAGGDCYVNACKADDLGPCAIEAMLSNNIIISTKNIGSSTYFNTSNALMVDSHPSSVYMPQTPNKNIFSIYEEWDEPSIISLQQQMRYAVNMSPNDRNLLAQNYHKDFFDIQTMKDINL